MKAGDNRGRIDRSIFGIVKYYIVSSLKMKYFILVLTIMLGGCYQSERFDLDFSNKTYMEELAYFRKEFVDHFPIRIFEDNFRRIARIQPKGFWSNDPITVTQHKSWEEGAEWEAPTLGRSSGGTDGTLTPIEEIEMFTEGLNCAKEILSEWGEAK